MRPRSFEMSFASSSVQPRSTLPLVPKGNSKLLLVRYLPKVSAQRVVLTHFKGSASLLHGGPVARGGGGVQVFTPSSMFKSLVRDKDLNPFKQKRELNLGLPFNG